jgi:N-acetyl-gamma-glutamyl-phosphate reductase common form
MINVRVLGTGPIGNSYAEILGSHREIANIEQLGSANKPEIPADVVITAVPHGEAGPLVEQALKEGAVVLDPSGDGRLETAEEYKKWYRENHPAPDTLPAVYGSPEYNRKELKAASYISAPGCYATAGELAFRPLEENGLLVPESVIECHGDSGYSGGGKEALERGEYPDAELYNIGQEHRHVGEMQRFTGNHKVLFVPKVHRNIRDGLLMVVTMDLLEGVEDGDVHKTLSEKYGDEPFVKILEQGAEPPNLQAAVGTDICIIASRVVLGRAIVISAIDNTRKGGASQGVHDINIRMGFAETEGLASKNEVS